jgi:hypothetical protein
MLTFRTKTMEYKVWYNGSQSWQLGKYLKYHRENNKPAITFSSGRKCFFIYGKINVGPMNEI